MRRIAGSPARFKRDVQSHSVPVTAIGRPHEPVCSSQARFGPPFRSAFVVLILTATISLLIACDSDSNSSAALGKSASRATQAHVIAWRPAFRGIELAEIEPASPRPMRLHAARIDLHAPGIRFTIPAPRDAGLATSASEVLSIKATSFLTQQRCQLVVNAAPFEPVVDAEGVPQRVEGLALRDGRVYSPPAGTHGVLMITRENRATITAPPIDTTGRYTGVGGFLMLLKDGKNIGMGTDLHPRTAAGVSGDGRFLILLVIDGRQPGYSEGASLAETAEWLLRLGAWTGLNLDGGGSTAMVIRGRDGQAVLVNRPIHKNVAGNERPTPSHLGVFADPLD